MLQTLEKIQSYTTKHRAAVPAANDNGLPKSVERRPAFPKDAVARIYKPSRSPMTSAKAPSRGWRLRFERRTAPFIEPLMGYTGGDDTLTQVELSFPTLHSAVRYAERNGLTYHVDQPDGMQTKAPVKRAKQSFSDATLARLGLQDLQETYVEAMVGAAARNDRSGPSGWASPMDVALDGSLPLDAKRSILMNWAYNEYLMDQATGEGMPDNDMPSRLDAVEEALLWLERDVATELEHAMRKRA